MMTQVPSIMLGESHHRPVAGGVKHRDQRGRQVRLVLALLEGHSRLSRDQGTRGDQTVDRHRERRAIEVRDERAMTDGRAELERGNGGQGEQVDASSVPQKWATATGRDAVRWREHH